MALKDAQLQFPERAEEIDALIKRRISGELKVPLLLFSSPDIANAVCRRTNLKNGYSRLQRILLPSGSILSCRRDVSQCQ